MKFLTKGKRIAKTKKRAAQKELLSKSCAQAKLVSPSGRDVAQRQRGIIPDIFSNLPEADFVYCLPSQSCCFAAIQLSQRESQEANTDLFIYIRTLTAARTAASTGR